MDYVFGLPKGNRGNDVIQVIIDKLIKSTLFLCMKMKNLINKLTKLYVNKMVWLHGVSVSIVRSRPYIYVLIVAKYSICFREEIESEDDFLSLNWWIVRKNNSDFRRPFKSLHIGIWGKLGRSSIAGEVYL